MAMICTSTSARLVALATVGVLVCVALLPGCAPRVDQETARPVAESPALPAPADLSTPRSAVDSYLLWTAYAYRMADSDVASATMSAEEGVRVDSYIQYNLTERDRRIDQRLVDFATRGEATEESSATIAATEKWEYAYLSRDGERSKSPTYTVSYETTYTLVRAPGGWVVHSVQATPLGEVE